jgi:polyhydroxyalkanoate synthase
MNDQPNKQTPPQGEDGELVHSLSDIALRSQKLLAGYMSRHQGGTGPVDPLNVANAFMTLTTRMMADPTKLVEAQFALWQDYIGLWNSTARRMIGAEEQPKVAPDKSDRRFRDAAWSENALFDFIKQSYLLTARSMISTVQEVEGLDPKTAQKVDFYMRQFVDALSPSNFVMTNPEVLRMAVETRGENLLKGLQHLLDDIEQGDGRLSIPMTDRSAFKVGENLATTPGKVVFQNALMQLIQYEPATKTVYQRPLLIIPPWINKYYILDLKPENSFIKWAVNRGYTVFVISWVNPDSELAGKSFSDYMIEGPLAALDAIEKATGEKQVNAVGYCIGGTLLASVLAHMKARKDKRIVSATFLTTLIDFKEAGDLGVFIDEEQITHLENKMKPKGYLEGSDMATTFNMLRANDLIWSFVVNRYLLGKEPFPFDLLFWNGDATRMPAEMHSFYLRQMYHENMLIKQNGLTLAGTPIDLRTIDIPVYVLSTRDDHIAPWKSTFAAVRTYSGPVRFVLAASGHIAGVVNPPQANKYHHWVNEASPKDPDAWLAEAEQMSGSWWPDWDAWLAKNSGPKTKPRKPGSTKLKPIEDAPGSYVLIKS